MEIVQRIKKLVEAKANGNKKEFATIIEKHGAEQLINSKFGGDSDIANLVTQLFNHLKDENGREYNKLRQFGTSGIN